MLEFTIKNLLGHLNEQVVVNGLMSGGRAEVVWGYLVERWLQLIGDYDSLTCELDLI